MTVRRLAGICLLGALAAPVIARAAEDDLAKARALLLGGKYAEAAEIYGRWPRRRSRPPCWAWPEL